MSNKYNHGDHMAVMAELLTLYTLKNETEQKINVATKENERMKELQKAEEEMPF